MATYISTQFSTAEEFENWIRMNEHANKDFLDGLCEDDKKAWDNKACNIRVKDGKLQLLCVNGNVLAEADYYVPDESTVCCDGNGAVKVKGIENANEPDGRNFRLWVGTWAEYNAIRIKDEKTLYLVSDDTTINDIIDEVNTLNEGFEAFKTALSNGDIVVYKAERATKDSNGEVIANHYMPKSGGDFSGSVRIPFIKVRNINHFPSIAFLPAGSEVVAGGITCSNADSKRVMYVMSQHTDQDAKENPFKEYFSFPTPSAGNTKSKYYDVLTSKNPVTLKQGGTGATTAEKARENLGITPQNIGAAMVGLGEELKTGDNLDSIKTPGTYYSKDKYMSATLGNTPYTGTGFKLEVFNTVGTNNLMQEIKANSDSARTYRRIYGSGTWGKWYKVLQANAESEDVALTIGEGGTGATTAEKARENLGVPATSDLKDGKIIVKNANQVNGLKIEQAGNVSLNVTNENGAVFIASLKQLLFSGEKTVNSSTNFVFNDSRVLEDAVYEVYTSHGVVVKFIKDFTIQDNGMTFNGIVNKGKIEFFVEGNNVYHQNIVTRIYRIYE